ncbi:MAG: TIGR00269 family protein [Candidatus Micrarchaeota archaeon]
MRCSHCPEYAVIFLPYADRHLCEKHFLRMFDKRVRTTVRQHSMIKKGERVAVGLSGGKDSCVLLHCLHDLQKDLPFELVAVTIDEGIRGYRADTLKVAKSECKKLGIRLEVLSFRKEAGKTLDSIVKSKNGELPCSYCGVVRRYLLNRGAKKVGADKLATGHNLDDVAQTVMMNIMRNEPSRLARYLNHPGDEGGMVPRIRPLMKSPEIEIAVYSMLKGIDIRHIECPYAHAAFRSQIRKILNETEERHPGTKFKVVGSFIEIEDALRQKYSGARFSICEKCGEPSSGKECKFCSMVG